MPSREGVPLRRIVDHGELSSVEKADEIAATLESFLPVKTCECCGELYRVSKYRHYSRFCSRTCAGAWRWTHKPNAHPRSAFKREMQRLTDRIEMWGRINAHLRGLLEKTKWSDG